VRELTVIDYIKKIQVKIQKDQNIYNFGLQEQREACCKPSYTGRPLLNLSENGIQKELFCVWPCFETATRIQK